jgi:hypothetical protein
MTHLHQQSQVLTVTIAGDDHQSKRYTLPVASQGLPVVPALVTRTCSSTVLQGLCPPGPSVCCDATSCLTRRASLHTLLAVVWQ